MTPAALTPAGKRKVRSKGHRGDLRRGSAPDRPRRVSGPIGGRQAASAGQTRRRPLSSNGYQAKRPPRPAVRAGRATEHSLAPAVARVRDLVDPLLDRAIRSRAWILILGAMLAGIVAIQVEVLKFGSSIGHSLQRVTALQSRNEQLRASVASLADDQRIERLAANQGMVMAPPDGIGFLSSRSGANVKQAVANIHAPNPQAFLSLASSNGTVTGALGSSSSNSTTGSPSSSSTSASSSGSSTSGASSSSSATGTSSLSGTAAGTAAANTTGG
jgi:hypothetical protein